MPIYEFLCDECGARLEKYARRPEGVEPPACPNSGGSTGHRVRRIVSPFVRHMTEGDKLAEAEAKWGAEVESVMGAGPDVASLARRYERLSKDLPPDDRPPH